jgi:hypothetical protein
MEPMSLALVGTTVLTEGIKFLFTQAGEVITRWRDKNAAPLPVPDGAPLQGTLQPTMIDTAVMERMANEIIGLRAALAPYCDVVAPIPVDVHNQDLLDVAEGLRRALEAVLGQRIRFRDEGSESSGPLVEGELNVTDVLGYVAGVRARSIAGGTVRGVVKAETVEPGGQAVGVEVDQIGQE